MRQYSRPVRIPASIEAEIKKIQKELGINWMSACNIYFNQKKPKWERIT